MSELKSFKKYSWLISAIFAAIVFLSGLTAEDISFLPPELQAKLVGIIGACAILVKILPENYRVYVAEKRVEAENNAVNDVPKNALEYYDNEVDDGV